METERLILRRFSPDDWRGLHAYLSDPLVVAYEPYSVYSEAECVREAARRAHDPAFWAVCLRESGRLIGNLYFALQEPQDYQTWELGYVFNRQFQGMGYATEAAQRLLRYGFEECGAHRVIARCDPRNVPSWRLLERLGMRREGLFLQDAYFQQDDQGNPLWHDAYGYAILVEEGVKPVNLGRAMRAPTESSFARWDAPSPTNTPISTITDRQT